MPRFLLFSVDGRLVLERRFPASTANAQLDLSPLPRCAMYHLLINGTEHHVVERE